MLRLDKMRLDTHVLSPLTSLIQQLIRVSACSIVVVNVYEFPRSTST